MRTAFFILVFAGCSAPPASKTSVPAAKLERTTLDELVSVRISEAAERALGLTVSKAERIEHRARVTVGGEVMVPAGRELVLNAPVGGRVMGTAPRPGAQVKAGQVLLTLIPLANVDRDVRSRAQREVDVAAAELELSDARLKRAETMVNDRSGSVRALEDARAQQQVARASVTMAKARLDTLASGALDSDVSLTLRSPADGIVRATRVAVGQSVPAGAALIEIASSGRWIRTPLSSGDAVRTRGGRAWAERLASREPVLLAQLDGPPSADLVRGTVDVFHALPTELDWAPGERVLVQLETSQSQPTISVPFASLLHDAEGGAWVYEQLEPRHFRRRRVDVLARDGDRVLVTRGIADSALIVSDGAVELWGFELGAEK